MTIVILAGIVTGCGAVTPTTQPSEADQRQQQILLNPGGYEPTMHQNVSTGSPWKDMNDVFNP